MLWCKYHVCFWYMWLVTLIPNTIVNTIVFTDLHLHHLWQPARGGGSLFLIILSFKAGGKGNYFPTEHPVRQTALHSSQSGDQQKDFQSLLGLAALWVWLWLLKEIVTKAMGESKWSPESLASVVRQMIRVHNNTYIPNTSFAGEGSRLQTPDSMDFLKKLLHDCWSIHTDDYMTPRPNPQVHPLIHPLEMGFF
jgi:hypothetical protein